MTAPAHPVVVPSPAELHQQVQQYDAAFRAALVAWEARIPDRVRDFFLNYVRWRLAKMSPHYHLRLSKRKLFARLLDALGLEYFNDIGGGKYRETVGGLGCAWIRYAPNVNSWAEDAVHDVLFQPALARVLQYLADKGYVRELDEEQDQDLISFVVI